LIKIKQADTKIIAQNIQTTTNANKSPSEKSQNKFRKLYFKFNLDIFQTVNTKPNAYSTNSRTTKQHQPYFKAR